MSSFKRNTYSILCFILLNLLLANPVFAQQPEPSNDNSSVNADNSIDYEYNWGDNQFQKIDKSDLEKEEEEIEQDLPHLIKEKRIGKPVMAELSLGPVISESSDNNTFYTPEFYIAGYAYYMIFRYLSVGGGMKYQTCGYATAPSDKIILMGEANENSILNVSLDLFKIPLKVLGLYPLAFLSSFNIPALDIIADFTPYCFTGIEISFTLSAIYTGIDGMDYDIKDHFKTAFVQYFFGVGLEYSIQVDQIDYGSVCLEYQIGSSLGSVIDDVFFQDVILAKSRLVQHYIQFVYRFWFHR